MTKIDLNVVDRWQEAICVNWYWFLSDGISLIQWFQSGGMSLIQCCILCVTCHDSHSFSYYFFELVNMHFFFGKNKNDIWDVTFHFCLFYFRLIVENLVSKGVLVRALVRDTYKARSIQQLKDCKVNLRLQLHCFGACSSIHNVIPKWSGYWFVILVCWRWSLQVRNSKTRHRRLVWLTSNFVIRNRSATSFILPTSLHMCFL